MISFFFFFSSSTMNFTFVVLALLTTFVFKVELLFFVVFFVVRAHVTRRHGCKLLSIVHVLAVPVYKQHARARGVKRGSRHRSDGAIQD